MLENNHMYSPKEKEKMNTEKKVIRCNESDSKSRRDLQWNQNSNKMEKLQTSSSKEKEVQTKKKSTEVVYLIPGALCRQWHSPPALTPSQTWAVSTAEAK